MHQDSVIQYLQGTPAGGTLANGNGSRIEVAGYTGAIQVEISESAGGTCTVALQGSFDGVTWYALGYQQVDNQASLSRSVSNVSVTANSAHVYQVLDPYRFMQAVVSAVAGGCAVTARAYCVPA